MLGLLRDTKQALETSTVRRVRGWVVLGACAIALLVPAVAPHAAGHGGTGAQGSGAISWRIYRTGLSWTYALHLKQIEANRTGPDGQPESVVLDCATEVTMKGSAGPFYVGAVNSRMKLAGVEPVKVAATAAGIPTARPGDLSELQVDATMRLTIGRTHCAAGTKPPPSCTGTYTLNGKVFSLVWRTAFEASEPVSVLSFSAEPDMSGPPPLSRACIGAPGDSTLATDALETLFAGPGHGGRYHAQVNAALPRLRMLVGRPFTTRFVKAAGAEYERGPGTITTIATFTPVKS